MTFNDIGMAIQMSSRVHDHKHAKDSQLKITSNINVLSPDMKTTSKNVPIVIEDQERQNKKKQQFQPRTYRYNDFWLRQRPEWDEGEISCRKT